MPLLERHDKRFFKIRGTSDAVEFVIEDRSETPYIVGVFAIVPTSNIPTQRETWIKTLCAMERELTAYANADY